MKMLIIGWIITKQQVNRLNKRQKINSEHTR